MSLRSLRAVATQFWINGVVFASFVPRLPEIRDRIGVDLATLGLLLTLGSLGGLGGSAVCRPLIERYTTRRTMVGSTIGLIVALPLIGFASGPGVLLVGLMLLHLFDVITDVAMNLQASWLSARRPVPVINRLHGLWSIGTVVGGVGASIAASRVSLRTHLLVVAAVLLATLAYVAPRLLSTDPTPSPESDGTGSGRHRYRKASVVFAVLAVASIALEMIPADWASLRLADDLGASGGVAGLGFVAVTSGMVVGRFTGDYMTVALGSTRLIRLAAVISVAGLTVGGLSSFLALSLIGFALAGLGASVLFPRLYDEAAQAPGRPGAALAALAAGIRIGAFAVPVTVGALAGTATLAVGTAMTMVALPGAAVIVSLSRRDPHRS